MLRNCSVFRVALAGAAVALLGMSLHSVASAGNKKGGKGKSAPSGVWTLKGGDAKLAFAEKDILKIYPHGQSDIIVILCK